MSFVAEFMIFEIWFILIGMAIIVIFQLITGRINLKGLLCEKNMANKFSPVRVQLLLVFVAVALYYLLKQFKDPTHFPMVNINVVLVLGGSNLVYIARKYRSIYRTKMLIDILRQKPEKGGDVMEWLKLVKEMMIVLLIGLGQLVLLQFIGNFMDMKMVMEWLVVLFIGLVGLIVLYRMVSGKIDLQYLISEENTHASMSRFQLLIFTFIISVSLFLIIISKTPPDFPENIPNEILWLLGISGGSYVLAKGIQSNKEISNFIPKTVQPPGSPDPMTRPVATDPDSDRPDKV